MAVIRNTAIAGQTVYNTPELLDRIIDFLDIKPEATSRRDDEHRCTDPARKSALALQMSGPSGLLAMSKRLYRTVHWCTVKYVLGQSMHAELYRSCIRHIVARADCHAHKGLSAFQVSQLQVHERLHPSDLAMAEADCPSLLSISEEYDTPTYPLELNPSIESVRYTKSPTGTWHRTVLYPVHYYPYSRTPIDETFYAYKSDPNGVWDDLDTTFEIELVVRRDLKNEMNAANLRVSLDSRVVKIRFADRDAYLGTAVIRTLLRRTADLPIRSVDLGNVGGLGRTRLRAILTQIQPIVEELHINLGDHSTSNPKSCFDIPHIAAVIQHCLPKLRRICLAVSNFQTAPGPRWVLPYEDISSGLKPHDPVTSIRGDFAAEIEVKLRFVAFGELPPRPAYDDGHLTVALSLAYIASTETMIRIDLDIEDKLCAKRFEEVVREMTFYILNLPETSMRLLQKVPPRGITISCVKTLEDLKTYIAKLEEEDKTS